MFVLLSATDVRIICRGLLVLVLIIFIGTIAVEKQLYHLTQSADYTRAIAMRQEADGSYRLLLLGQDCVIRSFYRIGSIATDDAGVSVDIAGLHSMIPRIYYVDGSRVFLALDKEFRRIEIMAAQAGQELRELEQYWRR